MCGADFFTAEVLTLRGLVRYMVFFVVDCSTRKVKIVRISNGFGRHIEFTIGKPLIVSLIFLLY